MCVSSEHQKMVHGPTTLPLNGSTFSSKDSQKIALNQILTIEMHHTIATTAERGVREEIFVALFYFIIEVNVYNIHLAAPKTQSPSSSSELSATSSFTVFWYCQSMKDVQLSAHTFRRRDMKMYARKGCDAVDGSGGPM